MGETAAGGRSNIVLIGMPGSGKSTVGVLLAKAAGLDFLDTDVFIQRRNGGRALQDLLEELGRQGFIRMEQEHLRQLEVSCHVIATGGSAVYGELAMEHLRAGGQVVHLDLPLADVKLRLSNLPTRGVVMEPGMTLDDLYAEREPLYRRWADVTVDCHGLSQEAIVAAIMDRVKRADGCPWRG